MAEYDEHTSMTDALDPNTEEATDAMTGKKLVIGHEKFLLDPLIKVDCLHC